MTKVKTSPTIIASLSGTQGRTHSGSRGLQGPGVPTCRHITKYDSGISSSRKHYVETRRQELCKHSCLHLACFLCLQGLLHYMTDVRHVQNGSFPEKGANNTHSIKRIPQTRQGKLVRHVSWASLKRWALFNFHSRKTLTIYVYGLACNGLGGSLTVLSRTKPCAS